MSLLESVPTLFPDDWARVRRTDQVTSHEAADSNNVSDSQHAVLCVLEYEGDHAQFEVEKRFSGRLSPPRVRSAFSELEALGMVKRTDEFRLTPSGRRAQVWAVA